MARKYPVSYLGENALMMSKEHRARLLWADRKAPGPQLITCYDKTMQQSISKCTTVKPSSRLQWVPLLSATNRRLTKIQLTKTAEQKTGKILPGLMSPNFCCDNRMVGSEFGIDLCCQQLRTLAVKQQCGESFLGHIGPLRIKQHLNTTAYLSTVADSVIPFMTIVYPSSDGRFQ